MPGRLPLTFQQEWLLDVIVANESWQCAVTRAFSLTGVLDLPLLRECLREVVQRHGALRMSIGTYEGVAQQHIHDLWECPLECVVVEGATEAQVIANARRHLEDLCDRRLNFHVEPLWNVRLLELSEHEHWLVLTMHRLIGDCASIDQTYEETRSLYDERLLGRPSSLKAAAQYADYTAWQQRTSVDWANRHGPYWTRHLAEAIPLQWPADTDLTVRMPGVLGKVQCSFGQVISTGLQDLARRIRTLPAMPMLAIYVAVLWRWCGQEDFVLPLNTAGRPTEYKSAIGYFSYALYLRIRVTGEDTFEGLVSRVANEFFTALARQDFGRNALQQPQLLSGTVFQWMTWQSQDRLDERVGVRDFGEGLTVVPPGTTAIEVTVFDTAAGLHACGSYRADLFAASTMERFMEDLREAAETFARDPGAPIKTVAKTGSHIHEATERPGVLELR